MQGFKTWCTGKDSLISRRKDQQELLKIPLSYNAIADERSSNKIVLKR